MIREGKEKTETRDSKYQLSHFESEKSLLYAEIFDLDFSKKIFFFTLTSQKYFLNPKDSMF